MPGKRIGFVDDSLDNFHANTYLEAIRGPLADRGYTIAGATALQPAEGAAWCVDKRVPWFATVEQLASNVDCFAVLAPSTPQTHLGLCEKVFPQGKPTFVDKTFAPDVATAERIFEVADQHRVAVQTTSALRTTNVQTEAATLVDPLLGVAQWAGGASFEEYGIHPVELAVSLLGPRVETLYIAGEESHPTLVLGFSGGRVATIDFNPTEFVPFEAILTTSKGSTAVRVDDSKLFVDAAEAILDFFDAAEPLVPREETLAVMRVLQAASDPAVREAPISV